MVYQSPLKSLHADGSLNKAKLAALEDLPTEVLKRTLLPGGRDALKARPDGTMLDGHHRIKILRDEALMWTLCLVRSFRPMSHRPGVDEYR